MPLNSVVRGRISLALRSLSTSARISLGPRALLEAKRVIATLTLVALIAQPSIGCGQEYKEISLVLAYGSSRKKEARKVVDLSQGVRALDLSSLRRGGVKVFTSIPSLAYLAILQSFIVVVILLINQRYAIVFFLRIVLRTLFLTLLQAFQSAIAQVSLQSLLHFQAYYISALYSTSNLGYIRSQIVYLRTDLVIEDRILYTTRVATLSTSSIISSSRISSRQKLVKRATSSIFF